MSKTLEEVQAAYEAALIDEHAKLVARARTAEDRIKAMEVKCDLYAAALNQADESNLVLLRACVAIRDRDIEDPNGYDKAFAQVCEALNLVMGKR